ncbi:MULTISPECIES: hypothetical protein [unclassified Microcoleus]|uniref:hypothetical protein n=1 Tax=unclassified Microcoleus TaxID=2642155 RepID=UPI002FD546F5
MVSVIMFMKLGTLIVYLKSALYKKLSLESCISDLFKLPQRKAVVECRVLNPLSAYQDNWV